jgi:glutamate decarboxylase
MFSGSDATGIFGKAIVEQLEDVLQLESQLAVQEAILLAEGSSFPLPRSELVFGRFRLHWDRGWQVPSYKMPANREDLILQRIGVRNGFTHDLAGMLMKDIRRHLDWFATQPGFNPTLDGAGYHH